MKDLRPLVFNSVLLGFLGLLIYGLLRTPQWEWPQMVVCLTVVGFTGLLGNMDRVESLKAGAGGIEARTRAVVAKAESTITELQHLAHTLAGVLFEMIDNSGRFGGAQTAAEKDARKDQIRAVLERIGLSPAQIKDAESGTRKWALIDYMLGATEGFSQPLGSEDSQRWSREWGQIRPAGGPVPSATIRKVLESFSPLPSWRDELLKDLEFFERTDEHRRPEVWRQRGQWQEWAEKGGWPPSA